MNLHSEKAIAASVIRTRLSRGLAFANGSLSVTFAHGHGHGRRSRHSSACALLAAALSLRSMADLLPADATDIDRLIDELVIAIGAIDGHRGVSSGARPR